jgi:N-formylglutamate deformylase
MNEVYTLQRGSTPLLISFPHVGTEIPADQRARYTERALEVEDTDWFLDRLYGFAAAMGASLIVPRFSRYLVDLNRSSDNLPMYPGQNNTELCPTPSTARARRPTRPRSAAAWQRTGSRTTMLWAHSWRT